MKIPRFMRLIAKWFKKKFEKKSRVDLEADHFAYNLLCPLPMLKKYIHYNNKTLCRIFAVTKDVIKYQKKQLKGRKCGFS